MCFTFMLFGQLVVRHWYPLTAGLTNGSQTQVVSSISDKPNKPEDRQTENEEDPSPYTLLIMLLASAGADVLSQLDR